MDPLSIAMLASGVLKYNTDVKNDANAALRNSVYARGGQFSNIKPSGDLQMPNFWGDMAASATAAAQNERANRAEDTNEGMLKAANRRNELLDQMMVARGMR